MLLYLKLGGSLITDKNSQRTARPEVLARLMGEIAAARAARPELGLLLGHGSGSFGHVEGKRYGTRAGVRTPAEWLGFAEVQAVAGQLNRLVWEAAREAGLPVVNFPPSASAICRDGAIQVLAVEPIHASLEHGLVPLVFGDVAIDQERGGTIVSTEDVFRYLAPRLPPQRILLAGIEPGVLTRWPDGEVIPEIGAGPGDGAAHLPENIGGSHAVDVTGGMASKVREMLPLVRDVPGLEVRIFSGEVAGRVRAALLAEAQPGTVIRGQKAEGRRQSAGY